MSSVSGTPLTPLSRNERRKSGAAAAVDGSSRKGKAKAVEPAFRLAASTPDAKGKGKAVEAPFHGSRPAHSASSAGESSRHGARSAEIWDCHPIAQNEVSGVPPVWSRDGRFFFTVSNTSIHIHSSSSSTSFPRLSTLSSTQSDGHDQPITTLLLSPVNPFQILSSSQDGTIKIWDWVAGRLVRTIHFPETQAQVLHIALGEVLSKWWIFAAVSHVKEGGKHVHRVIRVPLNISSLGSSQATPLVVGKLSAPIVDLLISPRSTYLVALAANKAYTYRLPSSSSANSSTADHWAARPTCVKFVSDQPFTCGAFSPEKASTGTNEEEWFATGDQKGVIRLWHGLGQAFRQVDNAGQASSDAEKRLPTTSLHWHAHAVSAIAFTPSGSQLLSVGEESVLVQWHLASGKREYIPRLGGRPIISLAVRQSSNSQEEEWWMSLADGAVVRVGASSGRISHVGQGIRLDPLRPTSSSTPYPITLHPSTNALVVPSSHPSTLQFIDPTSSSVLFDLEVAPSNRISRRDEKEVEPVVVERVTFSNIQNGQSVWMATTEGRVGDEVEGGGKIKNLKLWKWVDEKYLVNTQFPRPHGTADISSLTFSTPLSATSTPYLLTTSVDGVAKIWHVRQAKKSEQGKVASKKSVALEMYWSCRSTFDYRNMPILDAVFSPDSTIVALSHSASVSVWDVESNVLLTVLSATTETGKIGFVGDDGRYLVGAGAAGITVWDLLSCQVAWTATHRTTTLLTSTAASFFVVATIEAQGAQLELLVFSPSSSEPIRVLRTSKPVQHIAWLSSTATPPSHRQIQLVGTSPSGEIYRFGDVTTSTAAVGATSISQSTSSKAGLSVWQEMFGKDAFLDEPSANSTASTATASALQQRVVGKGSPADVFDGPSHTMPPTSMLFDAFMDELISGHTAQPGNPEDDGSFKREEEIQYAQLVSNPEATTPIVEGKKMAHVVDDEEVSGLTAFFKQVLSSSTTSPIGTGQARKINGHLNGVFEPKIPSTPKSPMTPAKKVSGSLRKVSSTSAKGQGHGHGAGAAVGEEGAADETPGGGSEKKKGKKRKAPRDE